MENDGVNVKHPIPITRNNSGAVSSLIAGLCLWTTVTLISLVGGQFHAACENHADCLANLVCNRTTSPSSCSCELQYRYDPLEQICRGDPGAVCKRATAHCTYNAECRDGACECAYHYVPHENKTCGKLRSNKIHERRTSRYLYAQWIHALGSP